MPQGGGPFYSDFTFSVAGGSAGLQPGEKDDIKDKGLQPLGLKAPFFVGRFFAGLKACASTGYTFSESAIASVARRWTLGKAQRRETACLGPRALGQFSLQPLGEEVLEQRLVGHIAFVGQYLQLADHGLRQTQRNGSQCRTKLRE